ncbi:tetratricopeptide repeat protein [Paludibacterium paludis]|uniref:Tetratricopeptide repeat protein n=1 Tax=Paludibacterium paludis TaxID=1225769 RepID=A0A918P6A2_9NEIS|nr:hypothetical protein [Paludibacterium paludis]GGY24889.1 hypothetical protein GCM10011289_30660 [Paludibacterium paludis]
MFKRLLARLMGDSLPFAAAPKRDAAEPLPPRDPAAKPAVPMVQLPLAPAPVPEPPPPLTDPSLLHPLPEPAPVPEDASRTTVSDTYGRELALARSEWRDQVVRANLERYRNDAESLCSLILEALEEGYESELSEASARLVEIDENPERAHGVRARVLTAQGDLPGAESVLREGMAKIGEHPALLDILAGVQLARKDVGQAQETLWQALQLSPQDDRLDAWLAREKDRGPEAYLHALERAATLPGAGRAVLELACRDFADEQPRAALARLDRLLADKAVTAQTEAQVVSLLAEKGQDEVVLGKFLSRYRPERHSDEMLAQLLRAARKTKRWRDGAALLARREAQEPIASESPLAELGREFAALQGTTSAAQVAAPAAQAAKAVPAQAAPALPPAVAAPEPGENAPVRQVANADSVVLTEPVWGLGLARPDWLLQPKPVHAPVMAFFNLAQAGGARIARDDETARLSRSIVLYLAESVHFWTDYATRGQFPLIKGSGPMVPSSEPDGLALCDSLPGNVPTFVTGSIEQTADGWVVTLSLWDRLNRKSFACESVTLEHARPGKGVLQLEEKLLRRLGGQRAAPHDGFYARPPTDAMDAYLGLLSGMFMLALVSAGQAGGEAARDGRAVVDAALELIPRWPWADVPAMHFFAGLGLLADCRVPPSAGDAERAMALLEEARASRSVMARLGPLVWHLCARRDLWDAGGGLNPAGQSHAYRQWLARVAEKPVSAVAAG